MTNDEMTEKDLEQVIGGAAANGSLDFAAIIDLLKKCER